MLAGLLYTYSWQGHPCWACQLKPMIHLAILYANRRDQRKSPGVPSAVMAIFTDRHDQRIKSPISDMSDIGD